MTLGLILVLLGAVVVVGVPFVLARLRGPFVLRTVRVGGFAYAALTVVVTAFTVIPLFGGSAQVSVPVRGEPIAVPANVTFETGPTATVVRGVVDRATITVEHLGLLSRVLLIAAAVTIGAVSIVIALALARIAAATLLGAPFVPGASRVVTVAAIAIAIGGTLSAVLQQWGEWSAGQDALQVTAWSATHLSDPGTSLADLGWPDPAYFALQIPFLPLLLGLGLGAIAAVFRAGEKLQRDTEGLV